MAVATPGPWVARQINNTRRAGVWSGNGDIFIADCCSEALALEGNRANARMIAAAPSMYALLQSAHDFIDAHSDVNRDGDGPNEAMALAASIRELLDQIDGSKT